MQTGNSRFGGRASARGRRCAAVRRVEHVLEACAGKRVLHLGCADYPDTTEKLARGTLLHLRVAEVAQALHGVDASAAGIELLRGAGFADVAVADLERPQTFPAALREADFDVLLAGEVIEHLPNPGAFLAGIRSYLRPQGVLIVTTVNAYCAHRFVHTLLTGRESVNPDHTQYFSRATLTRLAEVHGYSVEDLRFYSASEYEGHLNRGRYRLLWWCDRLAARYRPELADGIVARLTLDPKLPTRESEHDFA